jgi:hypothetical protein
MTEEPWPGHFDLDLGDGHWLAWSSWSPDRELNSQYADLPDNPRIGATIMHSTPQGDRCMAGIMFNCVQAERGWPGCPMWTVQSWEPLTISPSLLCHCGDHGHIREGRWARA